MASSTSLSNHDFSAHETAVKTDRAAVTAMLDTLVGSGRPFVFAPTVHGEGDHGFMASYVAMDRADLPVRAFAEGEVAPQFQWLERFLGISSLASSRFARELMGWMPTHPTLIEDLNAGYYTH